MTRTLHPTGIAMLLATLLLTGCAGIQSSLDIVEGINFERIDSNTASITNVYLHRTAQGMDLHGELKRKLANRGRIPGHLYVMLIDPQGEKLKEADVDYTRHNPQSSHAHFSIPLPIKLPAGSTIRITHMAAEPHDLSDHPQWGERAIH